MKLIKTYENFSKSSSRITVDLDRIVDEIKKGDISEEYKLKLDELSEYSGLYEKTKSWLRDQFNIFKDNSLEEIEDRFIEYFDKITLWKRMCMFALSHKGSSIGINEDKLNDESYFNEKLAHILNDMRYKCSDRRTKLTIDDYFEIMKPSVYVDLNTFGGTNDKYNLLYIEEIVDELANSMNRMYGYTLAYNEYPRDGRRYDPDMEINNYSFGLNLV